MRKMKKAISLLLAMVMVFAMSMTVMADETYTITINNPEAGYVYEAYQIFSGDLSGNILSNVVWGEGIDGTKILTDSGCADLDTLLKKLEGYEISADDFAKVVAANLGTATAKTSTYVPKTDEVPAHYEIGNLEAGYYFVKDAEGSVGTGEAYTKYILKVVKDTNVAPKTDVPSVEKKVEENVKYPSDAGYGAGYNDVADYNIGEAVPFAFYSKVPDMTHYTTYKYVFHDTMSDGLTFNENSVVFKIGNTTLVKDQDYTISKNCTDGCDFEIAIQDLTKIASATKGAEIRIDFTATLNANAEIGLPGNTNTVKLEYSNNPNDTNGTGETPDDTVIVFTYELDVTKVDGAAPASKLKDAEFILLNADESKEAKIENGKFVEWVGKDQGTVLKSDANGNFKVAGLDDGTYYLKETKAPAGYNLLANPIKVVISATTTNGQTWVDKDAAKAFTHLAVTADDKAGSVDDGTAKITVENNKGATLPETGGIGTTIFYAVGALLTIGAVVLMITKKRMNEN